MDNFDNNGRLAHCRDRTTVSEHRRIGIAAPALVRSFSQPGSADELVKQRLGEKCTWAYHCRDVTLHCDDGVVTLQGRVPTLHLKCALQSLLAEIEGVSRINNYVMVISVTGLSSIPPRSG